MVFLWDAAKLAKFLRVCQSTIYAGVRATEPGREADFIQQRGVKQ